MKTIYVNNQAELNAALKEADALVICQGSGEFVVSDSAQVRAYGFAQVTASGSAQVTASGSAQVTAYGFAQVRAYDSAQVTAYDSAQVRASKFVAVTVHGKSVRRMGGVLIRVPVIRTPKQWCEFYGVDVKR